MKKYIYLTALFLSIILYSCNDNTTGPPPVEDKGSLIITTDPAGAEIFIDGSSTSQGTTPDTVNDLSVGSHTVTLKLEDYKDTTFSVDISKDLSTAKFVELTSALSSVPFGVVRIYETIGTTASQPSGLDLSSGKAFGISGSDKDSVDLYYSSNNFVIKTADDVNSRKTSFFIGSGTDLNDGTDSPLAVPSWVTEVPDTTKNYIFIFDNDSHYSKLKIVGMGGGVPGTPAYIDVQWLYNTKANDVKF